jgi:hypothetical protein
VSVHAPWTDDIVVIAVHPWVQFQCEDIRGARQRAHSDSSATNLLVTRASYHWALPHHPEANATTRDELWLDTLQVKQSFFIVHLLLFLFSVRSRGGERIEYERLWLSCEEKREEG